MNFALTFKLILKYSGPGQNETSVPTGQPGNHNHRCPGHGPYFHQPALQHQHRGGRSSGQ